MTANGLVQRDEFTIPSDLAAAESVREEIAQSMEELRFSPREIFGVRLAFEEAVVNAVMHGNRRDPTKAVRIGYSLSASGLRITIEDEGEGFRPEDIPDPTADENLGKPSGRGLLLMRSFLTRVQFNETGNRVVLELERNGQADG